MGLLDFLINPDTGDSNAHLAIENASLREDLDATFAKLEYVEESLLAVADAFDNIGWSPMGFTEPEKIHAIPLKTVKQMSEISRALMNNPFVKRGVEVRASYIWGNGIEFDKLDERTKKAMKLNRDRVFSPPAYQELERAAATDGNVFFLLDTQTQLIKRIPLAQITGNISDPENPEVVNYIKREWTEKKMNQSDENGSVREVNHIKYYPTVNFYKEIEEDPQRKLAKRWGSVGVDQRYVMLHFSVNKQVGWRWGIPDVAPVIFWAKAYKEYLEDNLDLVKAYARIAMQVKTPSQNSANTIAAQYRTTPTRDPLTGEVRSAGATAVTGSDVEIAATGLNASAVDFSTGNPVAAVVAAGLELPLEDIVSTSYGESSGMNRGTLRAMQTRQQAWSNFFLDVFEFWADNDIKITWRDIDEDENHRRTQSIGLLYEQGLLHQEEARNEALAMLHIVPTSDDMPESPSLKLAKINAEAAASSAVPGQGNSGAVGSVNSGRGQNREAVKKSMANETK